MCPIDHNRFHFNGFDVAGGCDWETQGILTGAECLQQHSWRATRISFTVYLFEKCSAIKTTKVIHGAHVKCFKHLRSATITD